MKTKSTRVMKVLKKIRKSLAVPCPSGIRRPYSNNSQSPPLKFHSTHGENIRLLNDGFVAKRVESFCKGVTFSNRPVKVNEYVFLKFSEVLMNWSGVIRFGFTSNDPSNHRNNGLPKYACPDLTNKPGFWAKALSERLVEQDAILFYYVNQQGEVHYGINDEEKGLFFSGVDVRKPLYALVDVYGNTSAIEFIDPQRPAHQEQESSNLNQQQVNSALVEQQRPAAAVLLNNAIEPHNIDVPVSKYYPRTYFAPLPFHRVHGRNVRLSSDQVTASRIESEYSQGYVFTSRPLSCGEKIVIQVVENTRDYLGAMAFGLTSCDPCNLDPMELPDDCDQLLDRMEYWVVMKDAANSPKPGDELSFTITEQGEVLYSKNNLTPVTVMHVDQTQRLWAFFDIYGITQKIKVLGCAVTSRNAGRTSSQVPLRVALPPQQVSSFQQGSPASNNSLTSYDANQDNADNECMVCCERPVNSVLYTCGHMCMCYECAEQMYKRPSGQCPICRADIRDVIRTFRS